MFCVFSCVLEQIHTLELILTLPITDLDVNIRLIRSIKDIKPRSTADKTLATKTFI